MQIRFTLKREAWTLSKVVQDASRMLLSPCGRRMAVLRSYPTNENCGAMPSMEIGTYAMDVSTTSFSTLLKPANYPGAPRGAVRRPPFHALCWSADGTRLFGYVTYVWEDADDNPHSHPMVCAIDLPDGKCVMLRDAPAGWLLPIAQASPLVSCHGEFMALLQPNAADPWQLYLRRIMPVDMVAPVAPVRLQFPIIASLAAAWLWHRHVDGQIAMVEDCRGKYRIRIEDLEARCNLFQGPIQAAGIALADWQPDAGLLAYMLTADGLASKLVHVTSEPFIYKAVHVICLASGRVKMKVELPIFKHHADSCSIAKID